MKIITKKQAVLELKGASIVKKIILKYKNKIPLLTDIILIQSNTISHSHPILTLNTFLTSYNYSDKIYLS